MSDLDLDALEKIAEAATPGPWRREPVKGYCDDNVLTDAPNYQTKPNGNYVASTGLAGGHSKQNFQNDAAHIAAFDPPTVLALIAKAREAEDFAGQIAAYHQSEAYFYAQAIMERDNAALAEIDTLTADLATARAQLATAREALEPFAKRSNYLGTTADDVTHWHPAVGSPVSAGDLHRAREALSQLPYIIAGLATAAVAAGAVWGYVGMMARHA